MVKGGYDLQDLNEPHKDDTRKKKIVRETNGKVASKRSLLRVPKPKDISATEHYLYSTKKVREIEDKNNTDIMSHGEPNLVRYTINDDLDDSSYGNVERHSTEPQRRPAFAKKPKNPTDGSANYVRTNGNGSPNNNLPTIAENSVTDSYEMSSEYSSFRIRSYTDSDRYRRISGSNISELFPDYNDVSKFDHSKYFSRSSEGHQFAAKGTHPDSLYRVSLGSGEEGGVLALLVRCWRVLRWPAALLAVCTALALFIFYVMPDSAESDLLESNSTVWEAGLAGQLRHPPGHSSTQDHYQHSSPYEQPVDIETISSKKAEVILEAASTDTDSMPPVEESINTKGGRYMDKHFGPVPVYPESVAPDVQYGNEKPIPGVERTPKYIQAAPVDQEDEENSTLKNPYHQTKGDFALYVNKDGISTSTEHNARQETHDKVNFTSGHSKLFGISIEDAERFEATTANSLYNARYSPTLPALTRTVERASTTAGPGELNDDDQTCRSTRLEICRHVLPYDLATSPLLPHDMIEVDLQEGLDHFEESRGFACSPRALQFICHLLEPECTTKAKSAQIPCYTFCTDVEDSCNRDQIGNWTLAPLLNCRRYPMQDCMMAREPCDDREFSCRDGTCINHDRRCDGNTDCASGIDELDCDKKCNNSEWGCASGECLPTKWLCDGYADCPAGEDEENCRAESDGFYPHPATPQKLPSWFNNWMNKHQEDIAAIAGDDKVASESRLIPIHVNKTPLNMLLMNNALRKTSKVDRTGVLATAKKHNLPKGDADSRELLEMSDSGAGAGRRTYPRPSPQIGSSAIPSLPSTDPKEDIIGELLENLEKMVDADKWWETTTEDGEGTEESAGAVATAHASPCPTGELRCVDGRCIMFSQLCDGHVDCSDSADEDNCHA